MKNKILKATLHFSFNEKTNSYIKSAQACKIITLKYGNEAELRTMSKFSTAKINDIDQISI